MAETCSDAFVKEAVIRATEEALDHRMKALQFTIIQQNQKMYQQKQRWDKNMDELLEAIRLYAGTQNQDCSNPIQAMTPEMAAESSDHSREVRYTSNHPYSGLTRFSKTEFPRFNGNKIREWLIMVEEFFERDRISDQLKVRLASRHFDDIAAIWHQSLIQSTKGGNVMSDWYTYKLMLKERFGYDDPIAELKQLQETESIVEYHEKFEMIRMRVNLSEGYLVKAYLDGLRTDTQVNIKMFQPQTVSQCFLIGKLYERAHPMQTKPKDLCNSENNNEQTELIDSKTDGERSVKQLVCNEKLKGNVLQPQQILLNEEMSGTHRSKELILADEDLMGVKEDKANKLEEEVVSQFQEAFTMGYDSLLDEQTNVEAANPQIRSSSTLHRLVAWKSARTCTGTVAKHVEKDDEQDDEHFTVSKLVQKSEWGGYTSEAADVTWVLEPMHNSFKYIICKEIKTDEILTFHMSYHSSAKIRRLDSITRVSSKMKSSATSVLLLEHQHNGVATQLTRYYLGQKSSYFDVWHCWKVKKVHQGMIGLRTSASSPLDFQSFNKAVDAAAKASHASSVAVFLAFSETALTESKLSTTSVVASGTKLGLIEENNRVVETASLSHKLLSFDEKDKGRQGVGTVTGNATSSERLLQYFRMLTVAPQEIAKNLQAEGCNANQVWDPGISFWELSGTATRGFPTIKKKWWTEESCEMLWEFLFKTLRSRSLQQGRFDTGNWIRRNELSWKR